MTTPNAAPPSSQPDTPETEATMTSFICDVDVPHATNATGIPRSWIHDTEASIEARVLAMQILTYGRGTVVNAAELALHPADPPLAVLVPELEAVGYLVCEDVGEDRVRYRLVHPDRLPPLPTP